MALFAKGAPEKKVQRDLETARASLDALVERLAAAELLVGERKAAAQRLAVDGADDVALDRAEDELRKAQDRVATLSAALGEIGQRIAGLEEEQTALVDKRARAETSAEVEKRAARLEAAGAAIDLAFAEFVSATAAAAEISLDGRGLSLFAASARDEVKPAIQLVVRELRARAAATIAGTAPAALPKAPPLQLVAPPAPPPTVNVFALRHIAWTDHQGVLRSASANTGNIELPEAAAERGLQSGAVIMMSDQRVKQLSRSRAELFVPDPARCEILDDSVVPSSSSKPAKHSAFPLPPGEMFTPIDRGPPRTMTVPRGDVADKVAATRSAADSTEKG